MTFRVTSIWIMGGDQGALSWHRTMKVRCPCNRGTSHQDRLPVSLEVRGDPRHRGSHDQIGVADLISVPDAADRIGLHADTLYRLCRTGQFPPAIQIGARWRVSVPKLERYLHGDFVGLMFCGRGGVVAFGEHQEQVLSTWNRTH